MAKFRGTVGFVVNVEKEPGIYTEEPIERRYSGDLLLNNRRLESSGNINDNINISNQISILGDEYAFHHFYGMRYIEFEGAKWKVATVDASKRPRLVVTLGGLYNE